MNKITVNEEVSMSRREKEIFRMLRTNIEFTGVENRIIAVSSCTPNDGKSTVAYNLACAFAEAGKKTLMVDADLRKSVLLKRLQVEGELKGLSHLLSGQAVVGDIMYNTGKSNLYLMPPGIYPINPTELLGNERFQKLIAALRDVFEYVIIDTPPLGSVIDAAVVAKQCDGSILVLAANHTSRAEAIAVTEQMRSANPNILGVVLNKVEVKGSGYYGKKYGGYYGKYEYGKYGYGYGEEKSS